MPEFFTKASCTVRDTPARIAVPDENGNVCILPQYQKFIWALEDPATDSYANVQILNSSSGSVSHLTGQFQVEEILKIETGVKTNPFSKKSTPLHRWTSVISCPLSKLPSSLISCVSQKNKNGTMTCVLSPMRDFP